jgi:hypothetical protein
VHQTFPAFNHVLEDIIWQRVETLVPQYVGCRVSAAWEQLQPVNNILNLNWDVGDGVFFFSQRQPRLLFVPFHLHLKKKMG